MSHAEDWEREVAAYHEAGHAIIRLALGFKTKSPHDDPLRGISLDTDGSDRTRLRLERAIKISYAGPSRRKKSQRASVAELPWKGRF